MIMAVKKTKTKKAEPVIITVAPPKEILMKGAISVLPQAVACRVCHDITTLAVNGQPICFKDFLEKVKSGEMKAQVM